MHGDGTVVVMSDVPLAGDTAALVRMTWEPARMELPASSQTPFPYRMPNLPCQLFSATMAESSGMLWVQSVPVGISDPEGPHPSHLFSPDSPAATITDWLSSRSVVWQVLLKVWHHLAFRLVSMLTCSLELPTLHLWQNTTQQVMD